MSEVAESAVRCGAVSGPENGLLRNHACTAALGRTTQCVWFDLLGGDML